MEPLHPQTPEPRGRPRLRVCFGRVPSVSCCRRKGAARLARPPEGHQGPGPTCQRPAGRSPVGEKVGHLLALITQCQPGWESRNPDVPSCRDVWKRGAVRDAFVEVEHAAHPGAPWALTQGSGAHTPGARPTASFLISEVQLRALWACRASGCLGEAGRRVGESCPAEGSIPMPQARSRSASWLSLSHQAPAGGQRVAGAHLHQLPRGQGQALTPN